MSTKVTQSGYDLGILTVTGPCHMTEATKGDQKGTDDILCLAAVDLDLTSAAGK